MKISLFRPALCALLIAACPAIALGTFPQKELSLNVTIITSEHSRDSNSVTTNLRVTADTLVYEETLHGAHSGRRLPVKKEYKLTNDDRDRLIKLVKEDNLLTNKTISKSSERRAVNRDFELSIESKLAGKQGTVSISAPRSATELKKDRWYQNSVSLLTELYRVIQRTDPDIAVPELIQE
jgi:hypothetical protein